MLNNFILNSQMTINSIKNNKKFQKQYGSLIKANKRSIK